jgi:glycerate dehydrogenase
MQIVILDSKTLGEVPNLSAFSEYGSLVEYDITKPSQTIERIADADIIITNKVVIDRKIMQQCPQLKLICISATGMNNVDLDAAAELGIEVKNAVGYSSNSVAQHTFAMLLQLANRIDYYDNYVKSGEYVRSDIFTHYGPASFELHKKNFGIIGRGNIGNAVAKIAEAFGAIVSYHSTSGKNLDQGYPHKSLNELLKTSDVISIHAPLNEHTENLIGLDEMQKMKDTAIIVNVGRGGIVNEADLARAIDDQQIGGACIDVYTSEPMSEDHPFLKIRHPERLVLTPHNAWASIEARTRLVEIVAENVKRFVEGQGR